LNGSSKFKDRSLGGSTRVIYTGKTKRLLSDGKRVVLQFKDDLTGDADGKADPGGNFIVGSIGGKGAASAKVTAFLFGQLVKAGIDTHFVGLLSDTEIEVLQAKMIPLEVVCRAKAYGSFLARYRGHFEEMSPLDLVEFNLKDDALGDPLITPHAIAKLGIASASELRRIETTTRKVTSIVSKALEVHGLELIDMKLEFGRINGKLAVVDEISGDTMRVYDLKQERLLNQVELAERLGLT
jgi:phosphoribosylaminoimidazole-succinocarboxamide synthase